MLSQRCLLTMLFVVGTGFCTSVFGVLQSKNLFSAYSADKPSAAPHMDNEGLPGILLDGQWRRPLNESVQYDGDVVIIAEVKPNAIVRKVTIMGFHCGNFQIASIEIYVSTDKKEWLRIAEIQNDFPPQGGNMPAIPFSATLNKNTSFVKFVVKRKADSTRLLLGEIIAEGEIGMNTPMAISAHVANTEDAGKGRSNAQSPLPLLLPDADESNFGARIARSMTALATSTAKKRNPLRVLFYGQSITAQPWSQAICARLRKEYPHVDFSFGIRAIGGFTAERLVKTACQDLYPFYPDLVIFQAYGGTEGELENIISNIRKQTTAEIMISTHHISHDGNVQIQNEYDKQSQLIRDLAVKYDCELVDVREEWKQYLSDNHLKIRDLLADTIHLNDKGCKLMEALIWRHLRYNKGFSNPDADWIKTIPVQPTTDGSIKLNFTGNRVDIVADATDKVLGTARILIDGKAPSANPKAYAFTRSSSAPDVWWPALYTVSSKSTPTVEDWTLKITEYNPDTKQFRFDVTGSKTGPDGHGCSWKLFVSTSGRIVIAPEDFGIESALAYSKKKLPDGFEIKWSVVPMFHDIYRASKTVDPAKPVHTTIVQLIENGAHTLEIIPNKDGAVPIKAIQVFQPPLP
jgi:hypothetical protein